MPELELGLPDSLPTLWANFVNKYQYRFVTLFSIFECFDMRQEHLYFFSKIVLRPIETYFFGPTFDNLETLTARST